MKRQDSRLKAATLVKMSLLSCSLLLSNAALNAAEHAGHLSRSTITQGQAYLLPKILPIHRFDLDGKPTIGTQAGVLQIDVNGIAKLFILNPKIPSMKQLNKTLSKDMLGELAGPQGEDDDKAYYWTFHVLSIEPFEQNIYHIDVLFSDADQHWKEYRVRGYRIANPKWQLVE
ncbi:MAG: hypothetical protein WC028_14225 [Candidatus Obscuribacterales bacterium]